MFGEEGGEEYLKGKKAFRRGEGTRAIKEVDGQFKGEGKKGIIRKGNRRWRKKGKGENEMILKAKGGAFKGEEVGIIKKIERERRSEMGFESRSADS